MKKVICFLMALVMVLSLIPVMAAAETNQAAESTNIIATKKKKENQESKSETEKENSKGDKGDKADKGDGDDKGHHHGKHKGKHRPAKHDHEYNGYGSNPTYHWLQCPCGCKINVEPHVNPLETDDDYCFCGYHFSNNADLVTLWIDGCPPIQGFNKNKTEYKLNAYTYKDVQEIGVSTRTFDSEATVELPEDLTLKAGENKFEIKVVAENQKNTKVYTVIINKEAK